MLTPYASIRTIDCKKRHALVLANELKPPRRRGSHSKSPDGTTFSRLAQWPLPHPLPASTVERAQLPRQRGGHGAPGRRGKGENIHSAVVAEGRKTTVAPLSAPQRHGARLGVSAGRLPEKETRTRSTCAREGRRQAARAGGTELQRQRGSGDRQQRCCCSWRVGQRVRPPSACGAAGQSFPAAASRT